MLKKMTSVLLSFLIVLSSVLIGFTAFAAEEIKVYNGLNDNYQALAAALQKKYVTSADYTAGNNAYSAIDNEDGEIAEASNAFYLCIKEQIDSKNNLSYYNDVQNVSNTLQNAMGNDYTNRMKDIVTKYLSGLGNLTSSSNNVAYTFTAEVDFETAAMKYESMAELPDPVNISTVNTYYQTSTTFWGMTFITVSQSTQNGTKQTGDIKKYAALYSPELLATPYDELTDEQYNNLTRNGQQYINNLQNFPGLTDEFFDKFCDGINADKAQKYLDGFFESMLDEYKEMISELGDMCKGKELSDFDYDSLTELKTALNQANSVYNKYNNTQKNSVKSEHDKYNEYNQLYINSYNYNVGVEYKAAADKLDKYSPDTYEIAKDELEEIKALLDEAESIRKKYSGKITDQGVLDTQSSAKTVYDFVLKKYEKAVEKFEWEDYYEIIAKLVKQFDIDTVSNINSNSVVDDVQGSILQTMEYYTECARILNARDVNNYPNSAKIAEKIAADLAYEMGDDYAAKNVESVIKNYISGGALSSEVVSFTVAPSYLEQYHSVSEIPEIITYDIITYNYKHNRSGNNYYLASIETVADTQSDSTAYSLFTAFENVFTDELMSTDLADYTIEQLAQICTNGAEAIQGVETYDAVLLNQILGAKYQQAKELVEKCAVLMEQKYNGLVEALNNDYGNRKLTGDDVDSFYERCEVIDKAYDALTDTVKETEAVKANYELYLNLQSEMKTVADDTYSDHFADMVKALEKKYPKRDMTYSQYDAFSADALLVNDYYNTLSEEAKALKKTVKAYEDLQEIVAAMEQVRAEKFLEEFYEIAQANIDPLNNGTLKSPQLVSFDVMGISKIRTPINKVKNAYNKLLGDTVNEENVLLYMNIVAQLESKITSLTSTPVFKQYNVEYPSDVTPKQMQNIIERLDALMASGLIDELIGGQPLSEFVEGILNDKLFTADLINTLLNALYPMIINAIPQYAGLLGMVGIQVYPNGVAGNSGMNDYPETKQALNAAGNDWSKVDWSQCTWVKSDGTQVHDVDTFCDALGSALNGVVKFLKALFTGGDIGVLGQTIVSGNEGYEKDILPFLELLGCDKSNGLKSYTEFQADREDARKMLKDILKPLISRVLEILSQNTVSELLGMLPDLAYVFNYDLISVGLTDLLSPIGSFGLDINAILKNAGIDLSDIIGTINNKFLSSTGFELPQINFAAFAGIGSWNGRYSSLTADYVRNHIEAIKPSVAVQLLYYVVEVLQTNKDFLAEKINSGNLDASIVNIINTVFSNDDKTVVSALVQILTAFDAQNYIWQDFDYTKTNVNYPDSYSAQDVQVLADSLSGILTNVIELLLDGSLNDLINDNLYTGAMASVIFTALYSALDNETLSAVLSHIEVKDTDGNIVKVDVSKDAVYENLKKDFPKVAKTVKNADSLKAAVIEADEWGIESSDDFINAVLAILAPFNDVLTALLAGKGYTVTALSVVELYGANGYNNAVKPLLDALGCDTMSASEYNEAAHKDSSNALRNILSPLCSLISKIADDPVNSVVNIIPTAALFIDNGGIQTAIEQLLAPLNNVLGGVARLVKADDIYEWLFSDVVSNLAGLELDWNNLQNQIIPILNDKVLNNIKVNENTSLSLLLPEIDWACFGGCSVKNGNGYKANTADTATELLKYIWSAVSGNKDELVKLIESLVDAKTYKTLAPYIDKLLNLSDDQVIEILVNLVKGLDSSSYKVDWSFLYKNYSKTNVKYPSGIKASDVQYMVNTLSEILTNALGLVLGGSLTDLVGDKLYKDDIITTLAKTIFSLSENSTASTVLGVFGVDLSKEAIVELLKKDYSSVSKSIDKSESVSTADTSKWKWNVTDRESFTNALVTVLRPFEPVLAVFLNSGTLNIAGVIDFTGANGYTNAVKPLLDALGCNTVSESKYASDAKSNADNLLLNIINPLLNQVDAILANPIVKLNEILPQASNFIDKGGIQTAVEALIYPVTNLASPLLSALLGSEIYTDSLINTITKALYSLSSNQTVVTVFGILGVDFDKDTIYNSLKNDYPKAAKEINKAKTLASVDSSKLVWNVTDRASFAKALVAVLRPFEPVLNVLLNSGEMNIAGVVDFKGADGYANAVKPLLDVLGCSTVSASKYASDVKSNADNLLLDIINPLLNQVDAILSNPVAQAAELLPNLANFIDKGGVQYAVESLLYPVTNLIDPIVSVITKDTVFDFLFDILGLDIKWNNLQNEVVPLLNDKLLGDLNINGKKLSLLLPPIDWGTLAGCGSVKGNSIKADTGKELMTLLRYVFKVLDKNEYAVMSLVGGKDSTVGKIIANVINCGADKLTQIVVNILVKMDTFDNVKWSFKDILPVVTHYTANLDREDYARALEMIDPMINDLLNELAGKSLDDLVSGLLYTNNIVNTLAKLIYTNLEKLDIGVDINTILGLLDTDISTKGVASVISDYSSAANQIAKCSKWSEVNFDKLNWGFKDGDRQGFVNALAAVLRPLDGVLRAVLSGEDLVVLGSVRIKGGNGYNTAIIPIAEALCIDASNLVSPSQYANEADSDKVITNILNPLLDKVEQVLDSPVSTLADALPNIAYFVYNGGVKSAVDNLLAPVTRILNEIDPIYSINLDLSVLDNIDVDSLVNSLLRSVEVKGKSLGIQISDINLETLAGRGNLESYRSVRTYNGERMTAIRVVADEPAVFISVLRYLVSNIKTNLAPINNLLAGLDIPDNILGIINQVLTALTTENVDDVIEMLMDLLFGLGSGDGEPLTIEKEKEHFDPFNLGDFYWVYWVVFAAVVIAIGFFLFLIFKKKKEKEDNLPTEEIGGENI